MEQHTKVHSSTITRAMKALRRVRAFSPGPSCRVIWICTLRCGKRPVAQRATTHFRRVLRPERSERGLLPRFRWPAWYGHNVARLPVAASPCLRTCEGPSLEPDGALSPWPAAVPRGRSANLHSQRVLPSGWYCEGCHGRRHGSCGWACRWRSRAGDQRPGRGGCRWSPGIPVRAIGGPRVRAPGARDGVIAERVAAGDGVLGSGEAQQPGQQGAQAHRLPALLAGGRGCDPGSGQPNRPLQAGGVAHQLHAPVDRHGPGGAHDSGGVDGGSVHVSASLRRAYRRGGRTHGQPRTAGDDDGCRCRRAIAGPCLGCHKTESQDCERHLPGHGLFLHAEIAAGASAAPGAPVLKEPNALPSEGSVRFTTRRCELDGCFFSRRHTTSAPPASGPPCGAARRFSARTPKGWFFAAACPRAEATRRGFPPEKALDGYRVWQ